MADSQRLIFKVLSGPNAGAEAALSGRTLVGSAEAADIVIADPGLEPEHFTILCEAGAASLVVGDAPVFVKGEAKRNGTYGVAPFDLVKFGTTSCAIGPEGAAWPGFTAADLLPVAINAPEAGPEPESEQATAVPEAGVQQPAVVASPAQKRNSRADRRGGRRRVHVVAAVAALMVAVILAAGYVFFLDNGPKADDVTVAALALARDIVSAAGADGVTVHESSDGALLIEGFVGTSDEQQRLRKALLGANLPIKYRVVSLEQQVSAVRTQVASTGARLSVEADLKNGNIIIEGVLPELSHFEALKQSLRRDISDLRPLEMRVVTPEQARRQAQEKLAAAGLDDATKIEVLPEAIRITGALDEGKRAVVARIVSELKNNWSGTIKIEDGTTLAKAPVPLPRSEVTVQAASPFQNVRIVIAGKDGFFIDGDGRRYSVGSTLANGEVIEHIDTDQVVTMKDGVKRRYALSGGP